MTYYAVIHEWDHPRGYPSFGLASSIHTELDGAENALAYCEAMQADNRPGSEGRYFIVEMTPTAHPEHREADREGEG